MPCHQIQLTIPLAISSLNSHQTQTVGRKCAQCDHACTEYLFKARRLCGSWSRLSQRMALKIGGRFCSWGEWQPGLFSYFCQFAAGLCSWHLDSDLISQCLRLPFATGKYWCALVSARLWRKDLCGEQKLFAWLYQVI